MTPPGAGGYRRAVPARALDRLTIGHYMMRGWSLDEDVRQLERLGFRSISLASTKLDAYGEYVGASDSYCMGKTLT